MHFLTTIFRGLSKLYKKSLFENDFKKYREQDSETGTQPMCKCIYI